MMYTYVPGDVSLHLHRNFCSSRYGCDSHLKLELFLGMIGVFEGKKGIRKKRLWQYIHESSL